LTIVNEINTIVLNRWGLKCHPSISNLETDLGIALRGSTSVSIYTETEADEDGAGAVYRVVIA
jgi:hypothetical protein